MIARVLVSFTVTALSRVAAPRFHMLSQVAAAAVTDDVSLMAVPAKTPKALPEAVSNPRNLPKVGNRMAASTLKKKITDMAWATSSSSALITGAVAAMAEPPQMEEPTPTRVEMLDGICMSLWSTKAITREVVMVHTMMGRDCLPVSSTTFKFMPKPRRMTAHCSIFLEVNLIPSSSPFLVFMNTAMTMPARMAMTAPPMMGNIFPRNQEGTASSRQNSNPFHFFCNDAISFSSSYSR